MFPQRKLRRALCLSFPVILVASTLLLLQTDLYEQLRWKYHPASKLLPIPVYKLEPTPSPPIFDNFPVAASARSPSDLPPIPPWNTPPSPHVPEKTPLFIGFTRNWRLLQQVVVSYITAGWPPSDIYVVENTGTMCSNRNNLLTLQNPFYINHHRLTRNLGVNVLNTPTLLTFAQLQNFYIYTSLNNNWTHYFWAHMDTAILSDEGTDSSPYQSLYTRAVAVLRETLDPSYGLLATRWFAYDRLALVRTQAFVDVGGWDTMIPFYMTDCDMHERLWMRNFTIQDAFAGLVFDVGSSLDDLSQLYTRDATRGGETYAALAMTLEEMQRAKNEGTEHRNTWQSRQRGGRGEPFFRDPDGFENGLQMTMELGRRVFEAKWGRGPCDLRNAGLVEEDAWRVVGGWEGEEVQREHRKDAKRKAKEEEKGKKKGWWGDGRRGK